MLAEEIRTSEAPIILAEVIDSKEVSRPAPGNAGREESGYALTLKVHEVLRGDLKAQTIRIPFSPSGYARTWEFKASPAKGMKLLVFLEDGKAEEWNDYGMPNTIRMLKTFDDPPVKTWRKILEFWSLQPKEKQEKALRDGCLGEDMGFRLYCVDVLGQKAYKQDPDAMDARSFLWEVYTDKRADIDTCIACDSTFRNVFRRYGWQSYEPRYAILHSVIERTWEDKTQDRQSIGYALLELAAYSSHREETLELLSTIAEGPREDVAGAAALYAGRLYDFFPGTKEDKAFNAKLLAALAKWMTKGKTGSADSAGAGVAVFLLGELPKLGIEREDLAKFAAEDKEYSAEAKSRLAAGRSDLDAGLKKMKRLAVDQGPPIVQRCLAACVGKKIRVVAKALWERTPEFGVALDAPGSLVWLPGLEKWPFDFPDAKGYIVAAGELVQKADIPVFRWEKGKPFGEGLPVPKPYDLKEMSRRFVLENAKWEFIQGEDR